MTTEALRSALAGWDHKSEACWPSEWPPLTEPGGAVDEDDRDHHLRVADAILSDPAVLAAIGEQHTADQNIVHAGPYERCRDCNPALPAASGLDAAWPSVDNERAVHDMARALHQFLHMGSWESEIETGWHETHADHARRLLSDLSQRAAR